MLWKVLNRAAHARKRHHWFQAMLKEASKQMCRTDLRLFALLLKVVTAHHILQGFTYLHIKRQILLDSFCVICLVYFYLVIRLKPVHTTMNAQWENFVKFTVKKRQLYLLSTTLKTYIAFPQAVQVWKVLSVIHTNTKHNHSNTQDTNIMNNSIKIRLRTL